MDASLVEYDLVLEGILAIVRRETLAIAVALQTSDADATLLCMARLHWAMANARQFAARGRAVKSRPHRRLANVLEAAEQWLPTASKIAVPDDERALQVAQQMFQPSYGLGAIDASDTLLVNLDLDDLPLVQLGLRGTRVANVSARRAQLDHVDAYEARIARSTFVGASLRMGGFERASVEDCDLSRASLERTRWNEAKVSRCQAVKAVLLNARLDAATFLECDFRGANMAAESLALAETDCSARFIRCDLRESDWTGRSLRYTSFFGCRLHGAHGGRDIADAAIERPDLSRDGDGSGICDKNEVIRQWGTLEGVIRRCSLSVLPRATAHQREQK